MTAPESAARPLPQRLSMAGRHVVVTGAASGLGLGITQGMLESGATVTMLDVDGDELERTAAELAPIGSPITTRRCDVTDRADVAAAIAGAAQQQGGLHAAFANAGIGGGSSIRRGDRLYDLDWSLFERVLSVNLWGALATMQAAATAMRDSGGSIVATVSTAGLRGDFMVGYGYSAAKGALANLVRQAAIDLAPDNIRVNGIAPGPFKTNIGGRGPIEPHVEKAWGETILMGRMGVRQEIQGIALLLASDASTFMTGQVIPVEGGTMSGVF